MSRHMDIEVRKDGQYSAVCDQDNGEKKDVES